MVFLLKSLIICNVDVLDEGDPKELNLEFMSEFFGYLATLF